ncbi:MAG: hypothetical protein QXL67_00455 [Candidatus Bathyarchaeia archaeon]
MLERTLKMKMEDVVKEEELVQKEEDLTVHCEGKEILIKGDRYYTRNHMWAKKSIEGNIKVGVTDYAQKFLKEKIALLEISKSPTVGDEIEAGEVFGVVYGRPYANLDLMIWECMAFDLTSPVSGKIVKINSRVMETPQLVNVSPYEEGWIVEVAPNNPQNDLSDLITPKKYKKILERKEKSPFRVI